MPNYYVPKAAASLSSSDGIQIGPSEAAIASGQRGEVLSTLVATGAAVSLTTATPANVATLSLTAGVWDVYGSVNINFGSATTTASSVGINSTSATLPTDGTSVAIGQISTTTTSVAGVSIPPKRFVLSATTNVYLVASATFSAGTAAAWGQIVGVRA